MTYTIKANQTYNSIEVYFDGKPGETIRTALKALKFRWNNKKMCWYGFATTEEVKKACDGFQVVQDQTEPKTDKNEQKRLFAEYMEIIKTEVWEDVKMQEYARKKTQYIVELKNGDIIAIDKPTIETSFCFGYGMYLQSTEEEEKRAYNMEQYARTNENYFIEENLKGINDRIKALKDKTLKCYTFTAYTGQPEKSRLKEYTIATLAYSKEWAPERYTHYKDLKELDNEDRDRIAAGLEIVKASFIKRLNTYLKKYGLTKLKTWTYLVD